MKKKSIFNKTRIAALLMVVTSLVLTQFNFVEANQDNTPQAVRLQSRFADDKANGYLSEKMSLLRSNASGIDLSVALDPAFASGEAADFKVHMFLPTFELNEEGAPEQVAPNAEQTGMGIKATTNLGDGWYNISGNIQEGGWLTVGYSGKVKGGDNPGFNLKLDTFVTSNDPKYAVLPEGTTARIHGYVEYAEYNGIENNGWETAKKFDEFSVVDVVVSNLDWETKITLAEKADGQILYPWERYNYGDYHVTLTNTSDNVGSIIQGYLIGIEMDSTLLNGQGVIPSDINKWVYKNGQEPILNENPDSTVEGLFVGVEGQGGVLIYDITDLKEGDELGNSLPYFYTSGGGIMLGTIEDDLSKNEWIYPRTVAGKTNAKKFLVKVPYAPQGFPDLNASSVRSTTQITTNIRFAQQSNWTKSDSVVREFAKPYSGMTVKKAPALNPVLFGDESHFLISGITNNGKQTIYNPYIIDRLPDKGFQFDRIEIEMDPGLGIKDITEDGLFAQYLENDKWVDFTTIREIAGRDGKRIWSIDARSLQANSKFQNQIRVNTNATLEIGDTLPAVIKVYGKANSTFDVTNNVDAYHQSKLNINEIRDANGNLIKNDEMKYEFSDHGPVSASAVFKTLLPSKVNPKVSVLVGKGSSQTTSLTVDQDDLGYVIYQMGNRSTSFSPKGSVTADLGRSLTDKFFGRGFNPSKITLNKILFDSSNVTSVKLLDIDSKNEDATIEFQYIDGVLVSGDTKIEADINGDFIIEGSVYDAITLAKVTVEMENFITSVDSVNWMRVDGIYDHEKGQTATFKTELVLEQQRPHTDTRTISAQATVLVRLPVVVNPSTDVVAEFNGVVNTKNIVVPYERVSSFNYYFGNNSVSNSPIATFNMDFGTSTGYEGNIVQDLIIYKQFIESGEIQSITLYDANKKKNAEFKLTEDQNYKYEDLILENNEDGDIVITNDLIEGLDFVVRHLSIVSHDYKTSSINVNSVRVNGIASAPLNTLITSTANTQMTQQHPITGVRSASDTASWQISNSVTSVSVKGARKLQSKTSAWDAYTVPYSWVSSKKPYRTSTDNMLDMGLNSLGSFTNSFARNTGAQYNVDSTLVATTKFPVGQFDTYYMLMSNSTRKFVDTVEIYRMVDGKEVLWETVYGDAHEDGSKSQWVVNSNQLDGKPDGTHFRINLALEDNAGDSLFSTHQVIDGANHPYYRGAYDKSETNVVSKVVVTYQFNKEQNTTANDMQGSIVDAVEFGGRFPETTRSNTPNSVMTTIQETIGTRKPIPRTVNSNTVVINTGNTTAQGATGVNGSMSNKTQSVEVGTPGEYLVSVQNYGGRHLELSTSGYDDWSRSGMGATAQFQKELFVNFLLPVNKKTDNVSHFDAKYFIVEPTVKNYLTKIKVTHTGGVVELDMRHQNTERQRIDFNYSNDEMSENLDLTHSQVVIPEGHYPTAIELVLEEIPGFGETTSEINGVTGDTIGSLSNIQMRIGGIVNGNKALTGTTHIQRFESTGKSRVTLSSSSASITGRTSTLRYGMVVTRDEVQAPFYDFAADGTTPNTTVFRVDANNTGEANINELKLSFTPDVNFRTRSISIPATLFDSTLWSVKSVVVNGVNVSLDRFEIDSDYYTIQTSDLFKDLFKSVELPANYEFNIGRTKMDIRSIVVDYVAKGDHFISGTDHSEDPNLRTLDPNFYDFVISGDVVDESTDVWSSQATLVGVSQHSLVQRVSGLVKSPNKFTTPQNNNTYSLGMTMANRRTLMTTEMQFTEDEVLFTKNGEHIPQNQLIVGDRTTTHLAITNTGKLATSDHGNGNLLLKNPVSHLNIPKGIRVRSWKLIVSDEDSKLEKAIQNDVEQGNVTLKSGNVEVPFDTVLNDAKYKDLKNFRFDFTDTTIDYGNSVIIEVEFEAYNDFDKNNIFAPQGQITNLEFLSRPSYLHNFESYTVSNGPTNKHVTNTLVSSSYGGKAAIYTANRNANVFRFANPGDSGSASSATSAKIRYDFIEENISTEEVHLSVSNLKNYGGHSDTNYTLTLALNSLDSAKNHLNGFVLEEMPVALYPESFKGQFDAVKRFFKDDKGNWVEYTGQEIDLAEINELKFDYGLLPAFDDEGQIFTMPDITIVGSGHWRQETTVFNNAHTIKGNTETVYEHYFEGELVSALHSKHNNQTRVLKAMPKVSLDFQAFDFKEDALDNYDAANKNIKKSYRPNDSFWYKGVLLNSTIAKNVNGTNPYGTGTFENPVFIDRIPEYLTPNFMKYATEEDGVYTIDVKAAIENETILLDWFESEGYSNDNFTAKDISSYNLPKMTARIVKGADIGGAQTFKGAAKNAGTGYLSNAQPNNVATNPADVIDFLEVITDFAGIEDVVLDRGEKIEYHYSVTVREDNLPQATYADNGRKVYTPFMGAYGTSGQTATVFNEVMDMDSLLHDFGVSGNRSYEQSTLQFLTEGRSYISGMNEANNNYYDGSARSGARHSVQIKDNDINHYLNGSASVSDTWNFQLKDRVKGVQSPTSEKVLWAQSEIHLTKAWLYGSSEMTSKAKKTTGVFNPGNFYEKDKDLVNTLGSYRNYYMYDEHTYAVEYQEIFDVTLTAQNYGDYGLNGVEFIEILPTGVSPVFNENGSVDVKATLGGLEIDANKVTVEIIQTPKSTGTNLIKAPKANFEGRRMYNSDSLYGDDEIPYVIKITVAETLGKWFDRGAAANSDYKIAVAFEAKVDKENMETIKGEGPMWFDQVLVSPLNMEDESTLYYEIYSSLYGGYSTNSSYEPNLVNDSVTSAENLNTTSISKRLEPYTPYIRGINAQAKEMSSSDLNQLHTTDFFDKDNSDKRYASGGDQLMNRKPVIRTYSIIEDGTNSDWSYDLYERFTLNVNVENIHIYDNRTHSRTSYSDSRTQAPQTNGGARGSWFSPVVTVLVPEGVTPMDVRGNEFTPESVKELELDYSIQHNNISATNLNHVADVKDLFDVEVSFLKFEGSRQAGQYVIKYSLKPEFHDSFKILYNQGLVFSPELKVTNLPNAFDENGKEHTELYTKMQEIYVFASSERELFSPVIESTYQSGSYTPSNVAANGGGTIYTNELKRRDAVIPVLGSKINLQVADNPLTHARPYSENTPLDVSHNTAKLGSKFLPESFMEYLNNTENTKVEFQNKVFDSNGVYSSTKIATRRPNVITDVAMYHDINNLNVPGKREIEVGTADKFWYSMNVENRAVNSTASTPKLSDHETNGNVHHSVLTFNVWLPEIVSFNDNYGIYTDGYVISKEDLLDFGYDVEISKDETQKHPDKNGSKLMQIRIIMPSMQEDPNTNGILRTGGSFKFLVEARVTSAYGDIGNPLIPWSGEDLKTQVYTNFSDTDGSFNEKLGLHNRVNQQPNSMKYTPRFVETGKLDVNDNGELNEQFALNTTAIKVTKPHGYVRKNMVRPRDVFSNGSIGDPYFTGADTIQYMMSQVNNLGSAVPELILEDVLPHYDAPSLLDKVFGRSNVGSSNHPISTIIHSVQTGKWEIPNSFKDAYPEYDLDEKYRVYIAINRGNDWEIVNPEGASLNSNELITFDRAQQRDNQILGIRWIIRSDDKENFLVPTGFRSAVDADPSKVGDQEVSITDPNNNSTTYYPSSVVENAPLVNMEASTHKALTTYIFNQANLTTEYSLDETHQVSDSMTRAYLTPSRPIVDIKYNAHYFKNQLPEPLREYVWSSDLSINPTVSPHMRYSAEIINSDKTMWTEEESARYTENIYDNPEVVFELPQNFIVEPDKFKHIDSSLITEEHPLHQDYLKAAPLNDQSQSNLWTWRIVTKDGEPSYSNLKLVEDAYVGSWPRVKQGIVRIKFEGRLYPGDSLVVEYIGKVNDTSFDNKNVFSRVNVYNDTGMINPLNSVLVEGDRKLGFDVDPYDMNDDSRTNDRVVSAESQRSQFATYNDFPKKNLSYSELGNAGASDDLATPVPESKTYIFETSMSNPNSSAYAGPIMFGVLPYEGDKKSDGTDRKSQWSGILNIDSFQMILEDTTSTRILKESEYQVYVGPFRKVGNNIELVSMDDVPDYSKLNTHEYFKAMQNDASILSAYTVTLKDLKAFKVSNPKDYAELIKEARIVSTQFTDKKRSLASESKMRLTYEMKAPLNLPFYSGTVEYKDTQEYMSKLEDYLAWNTFLGWQDSPGYRPQQSNQAGVYINAPKDRAYIGDYIWLDVDQDGIQNEATYGKSLNGRYLPVKDGFKDILGNGEITDPGINGVLIELLTKEGYPSDIDGNPVMSYQQNGQTVYIKANVETGEPELDETFGEVIIVGKPYSFVTESDVYGNQGYFILSNLKPQDYRLKYTFPEGFNHIAPTGGKIHQNVDIKLYHEGDTLPEIYPGQNPDELKVNSLVVMSDVFNLEANKEDSHYIDFTLGLNDTIQVGGVVFEETEEFNGILDAKTDFPLEGYKVTLYDENDKVALNSRGEEMITYSNAKGEYVFSYVPVKHTYYAKITDADGNNSDDRPISPIKDNADPFKDADDNDFFKVKTDKGIEYRTASFTTAKPDHDQRLADNSFADIMMVNAGFITRTSKASIGNYIWSDLNRDGIQDEDEPGLENIELQLERYKQKRNPEVQAKVGKEFSFFSLFRRSSPKVAPIEWDLDLDFDSYTVSTNSDGKYNFLNLPAFEEDDEYVYGYRVKVVNMPFMMTPTILVDDQDESIVSHLSTDGYIGEMITLESKDERFKGAESHVTAHAGLVAFDTGSLSGNITESHNQLNLKSEASTPLSGLDLSLEFRSGEEGEWMPVYRTPDGNVYYEVAPLGAEEYIVKTDSNGYYEFTDLLTVNPFVEYDLSGDVNNKSEAYYYRVLGLPEDITSVVEITGNENNNFTQHEDRSLESEHLLLLSNENLIARNFYKANDVVDFDLDITVYVNKASISSKVFSDKNKNGSDDKEEGVEGAEVFLLHKEDGKWVSISDLNGNATTTTNEEGIYNFDVPAVNFNSKSSDYLSPYEFKLAFKLVDDAEWVNEQYEIVEYEGDSYALTEEFTLVDYVIHEDEESDIEIPETEESETEESETEEPETEKSETEESETEEPTEEENDDPKPDDTLPEPEVPENAKPEIDEEFEFEIVYKRIAILSTIDDEKSLSAAMFFAEPVIDLPEIDEPEVEEPEGEESEGEESETEEPTEEENDDPKPDNTLPEPEVPENAKPEIDEPEVEEPEVEEPEGEKPEINIPDKETPGNENTGEELSKNEDLPIIQVPDNTEKDKDSKLPASGVSDTCVVIISLGLIAVILSLVLLNRKKSKKK